MSKPFPMIGRQFGRWTVIESAGSSNRGRLWKVRCVCGGEKIVSSTNLRHGQTKSCGCLWREVAGNLNRTHGLSNSQMYWVWKAMIQRCTNPKCRSYRTYGGRGITVCERWRNSFELFAADMGARPGGMQIDRINNNGNYEPGNCRWASREVQNKNRRPSNLKLSDKDVLDIRASPRHRGSGVALSKQYGVSCQAICDIRNGKRRASVTLIRELLEGRKG